jgi:predicted nucleotidyltransferase
VDREALVEALRRYFQERPDGVVAAYLFGSRARGTSRKGSDVDLGVLFAETLPTSLHGPPSRIADALEQALAAEVQVVALNSAPPDLVHRVLRDGVLVHESDRSARVRFEVARRREYLDLLPILRRYRRLESLEEAAR